MLDKLLSATVVLTLQGSNLNLNKTNLLHCLDVLAFYSDRISSGLDRADPDPTQGPCQNRRTTVRSDGEARRTSERAVAITPRTLFNLKKALSDCSKSHHLHG